MDGEAIGSVSELQPGNLLTALGVGLTVAVLVAASVSYLFESIIEFSVFVGIPAGIVSGTIAGIGSIYLYSHDSSHGIMRLLPAVATFGFLLVGLSILRIYVPETREYLEIEWILLLAGIGALAVVAIQWVKSSES